MFPGLVPTWARAAARWCGLHLALSGAVEAVLAWSFGHGRRPVAAHLLLLAEWDLALVGGLCLATSLASAGSAGPQRLAHALLALTGTLQIALYALNTVSNLAWGRNMTGHLVSAFAPTIMSGREPFPVGPAGIVGFGAAVVLATAAAARPWSHGLMRGLRTLPIGPATGSPRWLPGPGPSPRVGRATGAIVLAAASAGFGATVAHGIGGRDSLYWKHELVSSFFRPEGFAFEPTERRLAVAERDAALRTAYPPKGALAPRKHVVLIIVDSLRADRMQVYGYGRDTTPFLSRLVATGRMRRVEAAFSTCSESFCGITSTLASREFRSLSARTFALQDVLQDQGYRARFLLSGNHRAWNGLAGFYRVPEDSLFDGSQTERFTMDDDRLVLEGLERVPAATADRPTFFYVHLMSTHYLGVQFPESHVFTARDDRVSPGLEPYKILDQLNKPDRYDDKVRQADAVIRLLFDRLRDKGYLDDAVVVVTGDHGEGLGERHWAHGWHLYDEDIRVPLLIADTGDRPYPDLAFGTQVDIAPTILDSLGLPIPESWDGESLLAPSSSRFSYHQTYFLPNRFAVIHREGRALYKFIATPQYGKEELYDLRADARETRNLVASEPELARLLRRKLREYRDESPPAGTGRGTMAGLRTR